MATYSALIPSSISKEDLLVLVLKFGFETCVGSSYVFVRWDRNLFRYLRKHGYLANGFASRNEDDGYVWIAVFIDEIEDDTPLLLELVQHLLKYETVPND